MKKWISYVVGMAWMILITVLAFRDGLSWSSARTAAVCKDGYAAGKTIYLIEDLEKDSVLYVADQKGKIEETVLASSVWRGSVFEKIDYQKEGLYAVLSSSVKKGSEMLTEYKIAQFDKKGRLEKKSGCLSMEKDGMLSGFRAVEEGFYLTFLLDKGASAGVYFISGQELEDLTEPAPESGSETEKKLEQLIFSETGRPFAGAKFEDGQIILRKDDGSNAEEFAVPKEAREAFWKRDLSAPQIIKLRMERLAFYIQALLAGYAAIFFLSVILRSRNHVVYTVVTAEIVLFAVTAAGAFWILCMEKEVREEETRRFGFYYMQSLADRLEEPDKASWQDTDFYAGREYDTLRDQLAEFAGQDGASRIFADVCLVYRPNHRIVASAGGCNGSSLEEVYGYKALDLFSAAASGEQRASAVILLEGRAFELLGIGNSREWTSDYLLLGVVRKEDAAEGFGIDSWSYLTYTGIIFLAGSLLITGSLIIQGRELKGLMEGLKKVSQGQTEVKKAAVHGRDVDFMWNSVMEIQKMISRIHYTKYRIFESCYRFAPKNIEKVLGKASITEVKAGDAALVNGTAALISLAETGGDSRTAADRMNRLTAVIEENQEENLSFFLSGQSSLTTMKLLLLEDFKETAAFGVSIARRCGEEKLLEDFQTGVLLHYSQYTYGVAGTENQSFPFLLSKELEELEKYAEWLRDMNLRLVITESVKEREGVDCSVRYIGYLLIPAAGKTIKLYEVLDAESFYRRKQKEDTNGKFQRALELFYQHDFYLARNAFLDVLKENPADNMAKWYVFACEKYLNVTHFDGDACRLNWEERFAEQI